MILLRWFYELCRWWCGLTGKDRAELLLGIAGVLVVGWYAMLTSEALEASTRPIIVVSSANGDQCLVNLANVGKLTAVAWVKKQSVFSTTRLFSGPPLPATPQDHLIVAVGVGSGVIFPTHGLFTKQGWFYMCGLITYGKGYFGDRYFTQFCIEYTVAPPKPLVDHPCEDPDTNNAN